MSYEAELHKDPKWHHDIYSHIESNHEAITPQLLQIEQQYQHFLSEIYDSLNLAAVRKLTILTVRRVIQHVTILLLTAIYKNSHIEKPWIMP